MEPQHLLFDENLSTSPKTLSGQLKQLLETKGWICHSVHEIPELVGQSDEQVIHYAQQHDYALLTLDKRMAYIAVKQQVDVYLVLHERSSNNNGELEEYTVVQLEPFAEIQAQTRYQAHLAEEKTD